VSNEAESRPNPPTGPAGRPWAVTGAAAVMILMAVVGLAYAIAALLNMDGIVARFQTAAAQTDARRPDIDAMALFLRGSLIVTTLVNVVAALALTALALLILRGSNAARVATWVVSALGLICGCGGVLVVIVERAVQLRLPDDGAASANLLRALADAYPSWWVWVSGVLAGGQSVGYLVVALLLALPAANAFFRRRAPDQWRPPVPPPPPAPPAPPM